MESEVAKNTSTYRVLRVSLPHNCAAIKQLLQQQIWTGMALSKKLGAAADLPKGIELTPERIPVHRLSDDSSIVYRSVIAFKLAPLLQLPAFDIADRLMSALPTISQETNCQMCLDFNTEVVFPGWIHFRLSEWGLATWLQQLIQIQSGAREEEGARACFHTSPLNSDPPQPPFLRGENLLEVPLFKGDLGGSPSLKTLPREDSTEVASEQSESSSTSLQPLTPNPLTSLFAVQYAHARCCSLLRLAHQQDLIKLKDLDFKTLERQLIEPNPIPWLDENNGTVSQQLTLRLVHLAERRLIAQILDVLDAIANPGQLNGVKLACSLSTAFEDFYRSCRIWGEVKTQTPKLAQARLGLVGITQVLLRSLLHDHLGVPAPITL